MDQRLIGVDVGGTKVSIALLQGGVLSEPRIEPTDLSSADALIDQLVEGVEAARGSEPAAAIGVGLPSVIDWDTGTVRSSVNIPLQDVPLRTVLRERLGLPVYVDNDASVAALAEAHAEDGTLEAANLIMFTVGTGVGGGVVIDGRVYRGVTGAGGEFGHMVVAADPSQLDAPAGRDERFPRPGSLESLASGTALDALGREQGFETGVAVVKAAKAGDEQAIALIAVLGRRLGLGIANAINMFDPEVVAIGGGVSTAGDLLLEPAREAAGRFVLPGVGTRTTVRIARSGPRAGVRGAALLAAQEVLLGDRPTTTIR
ncbi:ROK family protein [Capillimicrobium parvum]|uniref:N-acetyl-D-glucosamine kinase n=1 Tax=Capillimicrobium parvum TaxID=2884022 RepID=A0A9E6XV06_9ACTN|nr:ROK family protein [Capillimicrobium parvum]UGS34970.1 N-acetyl-D-glucosamine kinase [Capillimicrobium parvum]